MKKLLKKLRLAFSNPSLEASFRSYHNQQAATRLRSGMLLGALIYPAFILVDLLVHPNVLGTLIAVRIGITVPLLVSALVLTRFPALNRYVQFIAIGSLVFTALGHFVMASLVPLDPHYLASCTAIVIIFGSTFNILRVPNIIVINGAILVGFMLCALGPQQIPAANLAVDIAVLVAVATVALIASFTIERFSRRTFINRAHIARLNRTLDHRVRSRTRKIVERGKEIMAMRETIMFGLVKLTESRDETTGGHLERIRLYTDCLSQLASGHHLFSGYLTPIYQRDVTRSSILHDIGKVGIPDGILQKPARLTPEEFNQMKLHTTIGGQALEEIQHKAGSRVRTFLTLGIQVAFHHHEKWDGSGYPLGLRGEAIPLSARIVGLADVYDALTTLRPYKRPFTHEEAVAEITKGAGTHFDPTLAELFLLNQTLFQEIAQQQL